MTKKGVNMEKEKLFTLCWRNKGIMDGANSIEEMIGALLCAIDNLETMMDAGVELVEPVVDDYAFLGTVNEKIAKEFHFDNLNDYEETEDLVCDECGELITKTLN